MHALLTGRDGTLSRSSRNNAIWRLALVLLTSGFFLTASLVYANVTGVPSVANINPTVTYNRTTGLINLDWDDAEGDVNRYLIKAFIDEYQGLDDDGEEQWEDVNLFYSTNSTSFQTRPGGTEIWGFRISACNDNGCSSDSHSRASIRVDNASYTTPPLLPTNVRAVYSGNDVLFYWNNPTSNGNSQYRFSADGKAWQVRSESWDDDSDDDTAFSLGGVNRWEFQVRNCTRTRTECSAWVTLKDENISLTPDRPSINIRFIDTSGDVRVSWRRTEGHIYRLERSSDNGKTWHSPTSGQATSSSYFRIYTDSGLPLGTYIYRVRACDDFCSGWSESASVDVSVTQILVDVTYLDDTNSVKVSWSKTNKPNISKYQLSRSTDNGKTWDDNYYSGKSTNFVDKAIGTHSAIYYRVRACSTTCTAWSSTPAGN